MGAVSYAMLYLAAALGSVILMEYGWRLRRYRTGIPFFLLMGALAIWSFFHALSIVDPTPVGTRFWAHAQYIGGIAIGPLWLVFALAYADRWRRIPWMVQLALFLPSLQALLAIATNHWHQLWWRDMAMQERGPLFWAYLIYHLLCLTAGIWVFFRAALHVPHSYRKQSRLIVSTALIPLIGSLLYLLFGARLVFLDDPTPLLFISAGLVIFYFSVRYRLRELRPIAEREVLENMPDGVLVIDRHGAVASVNPPARHLLHIAHRQWLDEPLHRMLEGSPLANELLAMMQGADENQLRQMIYRAGDQLQLYGVEVRLHPLREANGASAGTLLVLRDITDQVRMEQTLDQRFAEISLINHVARSANASYHIDELTRLLSSAITVLPPWEWVAMALRETLHDQQLRFIGEMQGGNGQETIDLRLFADTLEAGQTRIFWDAHPEREHAPALLLRRFGLRTMIVVPLISHNEQLGVLCAGCAEEIDIPFESIRLLETLAGLVGDAIVRTRLYEEAQQASRLKTAFLATVSHELRTPLTSIIGYADMLRRGVYGSLPVPTHSALDSLHRSSMHLLHLINDILDYSKMEAGHFDLHLYPVDLRSAVTNVTMALRPQIEERNLTVQLDLPTQLPFIYGDGMRLEQVLTNLVANAIKFTDEGSITIRARQQGCRLRLSVIDTGIGIDPEAQKLIFREFRQIENDHTRRYGGAGLGLAISRRLVELMGGSISLESQPGKGSAFHCDFATITVDTEHAAVVG